MKVKTELSLLTLITFGSFLLIILALRIVILQIDEYRERERYAYDISHLITRLNHQLRNVVIYREDKAIKAWFDGQQKLTAAINTPPPLSSKQKYLLHGISKNNYSVITLFSLLQAKTNFPLGDVKSPVALHLIGRLYAQIESIREDSLLLAFEASRDINEVISNRIYMITLMLCILGLLLVASSIHLSKKVTSSLRTINLSLKKVSKGDFDEKLPHLKNDEFDEVARHFNEMTSDLKFKTITMDKLQVLVDQRTEALQKLSETDALTNIANRRSYERRLHIELASAKRNKMPLSLLMIDVDHFKEYNDGYGHDAGDSALQSVAKSLSTTLPRDTDFVARFGGEEFIILLPSTDAIGASMIAKRLSADIKNMQIPHEFSPVDDFLTVSIGIATYDITIQSDVDLLKQADMALYSAKENGRNQCHAYTI